MYTPIHTPETRSQIARQRMLEMEGRPRLFSDWDRAVFIHFQVPADVLQPLVPFELDLWQGKAYVSLVAFTMNNLRPAVGGRLGALLMSPISSHPFLNVRTYVRNGGETGIFFLIEWLSNRMSALLGPKTFGLPYRFGRLAYHHNPEDGSLRGQVTSPDAPGSIHYHATIDPNAPLEPASPDSLDEFLLERYIAFTMRGQTPLYFRIWHVPWPQTPVDLQLHQADLLDATGNWRADAKSIGANYSSGVRGVWMGLPHRCSHAGGVG